MPIRHALWTVGPDPRPVREDRLPDERTLEDMIAARPEILSDQWMPVAAKSAPRMAASSISWPSRPMAASW